MRLLVIAILALLALVVGCGPSEDQPTPDEAAHLDMLRQATVKQLEMMLGRSRTDEEKKCIVVKLKGGKLDSRLVAPLSETVKEWHRRAQTKPS
jgi:hypothetical protein